MIAGIPYAPFLIRWVRAYPRQPPPHPAATAADTLQAGGKKGREAGVAGVHLEGEGGLHRGRGIPAPRSGRGARSPAHSGGAAAVSPAYFHVAEAPGAGRAAGSR